MDWSATYSTVRADCSRTINMCVTGTLNLISVSSVSSVHGPICTPTGPVSTISIVVWKGAGKLFFFPIYTHVCLPPCFCFHFLLSHAQLTRNEREYNQDKKDKRSRSDGTSTLGNQLQPTICTYHWCQLVRFSIRFPMVLRRYCVTSSLYTCGVALSRQRIDKTF